MKKVCQNVREGHRENIKWGIIARTTWGKGESDISMPSCCSTMLRSRKEDGRIVVWHAEATTQNYENHQLGKKMVKGRKKERTHTVSN